MDFLKIEPGLSDESCPASSHVGTQVIDIKVEVSDAQEVEDPLLITLPEIKAEHEHQQDEMVITTDEWKGCGRKQSRCCSCICLKGLANMDCMNLLKVEPDSVNETCPMSSHDGNQIIDIKVEEDPVPIKFPQIKPEHENCMDSLKVESGSISESCPTSSHDGDQIIGMKVEEASDTQELADPLLITFPDIKAERKICTDFLKIEPGSSSETCPTPRDENHMTDIKVEEDPVPITFPGIKAEHEDTQKEPRVTHDVDRPYFCSVCHKSFSRQSNLKLHHRIHSGERPYACDMCNKSFNQQGHLKIHRRIHSGERPFSCSVCNKSFSNQGNLKAHQRAHSGERSFSCNICNKSFIQQNTLKQHQRTHSAQRPFSCNVCNKSFSLQSYLKTHHRVHSGERPFSCNMCSKSFSQQGALKQHERIHTGERPFSCNVCSKSFIRRSDLKRHHHKEHHYS